MKNILGSRFLAALLMLVVAGGEARARVQDAASASPGEVGAPDSGFVDLAKRGSSKIKQAIADYLDECDLRLGENPNGLWVQTGTAAVAGRGGSAQWGENRKMAFIEAQLLAQTNIIKAIARKNAVLTVRELSTDESMLTPQFMEPEGFEDRLQSKLNQLTEASIDAALKDLGETPPPTAKLESKRDLYRKSLMRVSYSEAYSSVSGFSVLQSFESTDEGDTGKVSVGVVIGRRPNSLGWIGAVAKGGGATGIPRDKPGRPLSERIPRDPSVLFERFGTRLVADENGQVCIIAYGQSAPNITKGTPEDVIDQKLEAAASFAEMDAMNALTEFLDSTVSWQQRQEEGQVQRRTETKSTLGGVEVTGEENVTDMIKKLNEKTVKWSEAIVRGATPYYTWQGNHPDYGNPLVGCVIVWTPEAAAAAGRFNRPGAAGRDGFKASGGTPGVRRSRDEDVPSGRGPGSDDAQAPAGNSGCEGTEAVGEGSDREAATLSALKNAVRQSCGVAVESNTVSEKATLTAVADIRVNDACEEMTSAFVSSSLLKQDISVRTRGLIRSYRVVEEWNSPGGTGSRVTVCAEVAKFDPKNPRPGARPTLVILSPECRNDGFSLMGAAVAGREFSAALEAGLSRSILKSKAFSILERQRLSSVLGEQALAASGLADILEQAKLGRLLTADCILVTEIADANAAEEERIIKLTGARLVKRSASATVHWKLISVGTGELLDQDSVVIALDDEGMKGLARQYPGATISSALMSACVERMVSDLVGRAAPLKVAQVVKDKVFLNQGREILKPGQMFTVYRQLEELRDPTTGAQLGRSEERVGVIKVDRCESDFSLALLISGDLADSDVGAICRPGV